MSEAAVLAACDALGLSDDDRLFVYTPEVADHYFATRDDECEACGYWAEFESVRRSHVLLTNRVHHLLAQPTADEAEGDVGLRERVEAVEVVRGFVTHDDGSQSPVERWVRASDDRWLSLDSERQTRRDLTWVMDPVEVEAGVFSDPSIHHAFTARGRSPKCLPFCQGGLHEEGCHVLADTPPAPERGDQGGGSCTHPHYNSAGICGGCGHRLGSTGGER